MKTLIILSAVPASGKSTWAKEYKLSHPGCFIVSSDAIRYEVTNGHPQDRSKQSLVWVEFDKKIQEYSKIDNVTVILDALNDLNSLRKKYVTENPNFDQYKLVLFERNLDRSRQLNAKRDEISKVPEDALEMLFNKFEDPDEETLKLFDEVINVKWEVR